MKTNNKKVGNLYLFIMMIMVVIVLGCSPVYASSRISISIDGKALYMDVPPIIMDGRTMVPLRVVSEAVGCKVDWFSEDQRIVVYSPAGGDPLLVMSINDKNVTLNHYNGNTGEISGKVVTIEAPPAIVDGRTMVPLRFVAETIGYKVEWDNASRTLFLFSANYEGDYGDNLAGDLSDSGDSYASVQAMFPRGAVYTEEYNIEGDAGEGLTPVDAALTLTWDKLNDVYDVYNSSDPVYITLVGLQFVGGEECYIFQVKKAQYSSTLYAVGHSGKIYENFLFN